MKTRGLTAILPFLLLALIGSSKTKHPTTAGPNGYIGGGSPVFIPRRGKLKGYMRENRRTDRGHGYMKYKFQNAR